MTAEYQHEVHQQRAGVFEIGGGGSITRTFLVTTDTAADGPVEVASALPVQLGDLHPSATSHTLQRITCSPIAVPSLHWFASCEYSRLANNIDDDANPLNVPVEVSCRGVKVTKSPLRDLDGLAFINTAGDPLDETPQIERSYPVVTFKRNEAAFSYATHMERYLDKVNSGSFMGADTGTVKCSDLSADKKFKDQMTYWEVRYEFSFNPDGWQPNILNEGYYYLDGANKKRCVDVDGRDVASPAPLSVDGEQIPSSGIPDDLYFLPFRMFDSVNFNLLGLPT